MNAPLQLIPVLEPLRPDMEQVVCVLNEVLDGVEEPLRSMLCHALDGGKRLRSALVILVGRVFDAPIAPFSELAAAVDMLHTATLIHDDLVDGAPLRRGREALHTAWPTGAAVLAGDYLLGEATALIARQAHPAIFGVFADILCTMCAGEVKRMLATRGRHNSREDYYGNIEAKTSSFFAATTEMAAMLAGADECQVVALRRFGRELGVAFQIMDDVLDLTGDESQLGKPAGSDLRQGLVTLPTLLYLEDAADGTPVHAVLNGRQDDRYVQAAMAAVCSSGAIEAALAEARFYATQCQEALAPLPDNAYCRMLCSLADYVVERTC
jgi:geranylgeranyl pyrophosphate synthase